MSRTGRIAAVVLWVAVASNGGGRAADQAPDVTFVPAADVEAAFAKGMPIVERDGYKVHASRRDGPGKAEVHTRDTDILYVLEGTSTIVTGGEVMEPQTTAPEEIRGASIRGGEVRRLARGDLLIVRRGVPHWFKEVSPPFLYFAVKVRESAAGDR